MKFKQRPREEQAEPDETEEAGAVAEMYGIDMDVSEKGVLGEEGHWHLGTLNGEKEGFPITVFSLIN
jgi:hypothetical protein